MAERTSRKLAVILHADVVGSTVLVQRDESVAHERIQASFRCFSETIAAYGGITQEIRGDALVAEFARASDAVSAGTAFQEANTHFNAQLEDDIQPHLRIGISLGEVIIADNTVTGTGIVLAQRLEQLAPPGGVVVQGSISETVPTRLPFVFNSLGEQTLKGLDQPIRAFGVELKSGESIPRPEATDSIQAFQQPSPSAARSTSIAVLPFTNLSGGPDQDSFCTGITEDIVTALSRASGLEVISALSALNVCEQQADPKRWVREQRAQFILGGSVRASGRRIRITAQLLDVGTGRHRWSERYDRELDDIFAVQDEVTQRIVVEVRGELVEGEDIRVTARATDNVEALDYVIRAWDLERRGVQDSNAEARRYAQKAVECDPNFSDAWNFLSWTHWHDAHFGWSDSREGSLRRAREAAEKSASLARDEDDFLSRILMGSISLLEHDSDVAIELTRKAVNAHPRVCEHAALLAMVLLNSGHVEEGVAKAKRAITLTQAVPAWCYAILGCALHLAGELEDAIDVLRQGMALEPSSPHCVIYLAGVLAEAGQLAEARSTATLLITSIHPKFSITAFGQNFPDKSVRARLTENWLAAGLPV